MLNRIDSAILSACTKFSHWLQRTTGLTNYFVAKIGIAVVALNIMIDTMNYFHQILSYKTPFFICFMNGVIFIHCIWRTFECQKADEGVWAARKTKPSFLMRYVALGKFWRLMWLASFVIDVAGWCITPHARIHYQIIEAFSRMSFSLGLAVFYYFIVVDPLPPGKSKIREWLENFGRRPVPVSVEN